VEYITKSAKVKCMSKLCLEPGNVEFPAAPLCLFPLLPK
jgi:hypothetical protein